MPALMQLSRQHLKQDFFKTAPIFLEAPACRHKDD